MGLTLFKKQPQQLAVVRQYLVTILASLPFAVAGAAIAWPSSTLSKILSGDTSLSLDATETSWMVSLLYLGKLLGALPSAYLSEKIGRKKTLLYSGVFPVISWSIILSSETVLWLYFSRFLAGLQIGVITVVYPLYVSEISQTDIRGSLTALCDVTFNAGIFFVSAVGPFVSYPVLVSIFVFLSCVFSISFQFAPESPHDMLVRDDIATARNSLMWLRGGLNRIELEFELDRTEKLVKNRQQEQGFMREMLFSKTLLVVLLLSALDGLQGVNVIQAYASVTFPKTTFGILAPNDCMIVLSSATFVSSLIFAYISGMLHVKKVSIASYCGSSLSMGAVAVWFFLRSKSEVDITSLDCVPFLGCFVHLIISTFFHSTSLKYVNNQSLSPKSKTVLTVISTVTKSTIYFVLNKIYLEMGQREYIYMNFVIYSVGCFLAAFFLISFWASMVNDRTVQDDQENSTEDESSKSSIVFVNGSF